MTTTQRESVARAIYACYVAHNTDYILNMLPWHLLHESTREMYRCLADAAYGAMMAVRE